MTTDVFNEKLLNNIFVSVPSLCANFMALTVRRVCHIINCSSTEIKTRLNMDVLTNRNSVGASMFSDVEIDTIKSWLFSSSPVSRITLCSDDLNTSRKIYSVIAMRLGVKLQTIVSLLQKRADDYETSVKFLSETDSIKARMCLGEFDENNCIALTDDDIESLIHVEREIFGSASVVSKVEEQKRNDVVTFSDISEEMVAKMYLDDIRDQEEKISQQIPDVYVNRDYVEQTSVEQTSVEQTSVEQTSVISEQVLPENYLYMSTEQIDIYNTAYDMYNNVIDKNVLCDLVLNGMSFDTISSLVS